MAKLSTLIVILGVMVLSAAVFASSADGAGIVWRAINKSGSLVSDLANVAGGCTNGQVLQFQTSNSTFICATVSGGGGFTSIVNRPASTAKILAANSTSKAEFKSLTQGTGITITNGTSDVTITNAGVTSIAGTANNVTLSGSTGAVTANLGSNVVITGGSAQTITKTLTMTTPQINGIDLAITTQSASYTATSTDDVILMDASAANRTLTLPAAASNTGKIFYIKSIGTPGVNTVMVDGNGAETIDGFANFNMTMTDEVSVIQSDGSGWRRLDGDAIVPLRAGTPANRWYGTAQYALGTSTITSVTGTLRATPFIVPSSMTMDQIQTEISTAANPTTTQCRMGIYRDNGNVYPGALVSGSDVAVFTTTAGVKTNTFASPIKLQKGLYWFAYTCATAATTQPTFRGLSVGAVPAVIGYPSTMGASGYPTLWTVSFTFAALPVSFPAAATTSTNVPAMILVRVTG